MGNESNSRSNIERKEIRIKDRGCSATSNPGKNSNTHQGYTMIKDTITKNAQSIVNEMLNKNYEQATEEWITIAQEAYAIQSVRMEYEKQEKKLFECLRQLQKTTLCQGGGFIYECTTRKGSVDYGSIPMLSHINLEQYRKEDVKTWKLKTY